MIHQQDIRRPLGLPRDIPAARMIAALDFARSSPLIKAPGRIKGLTLVATDLDWTTGAGPRVEGPAEALLLAAAGRSGGVRLRDPYLAGLHDAHREPQRICRSGDGPAAPRPRS